VCPAASGAAVADPRLAHHLGGRRRVLGFCPDHGPYRACQGGTGHLRPPSGPGLPACELPAKPCSARGRPRPWTLARPRDHDRTRHGGEHRLTSSRATRSHTSLPVSGIGMPKLWAYTSSRGTAVASTS
jgi:hypothetical protein